MLEKPVPQPRSEARPFWDGAKRSELWIQRCDTTGRAFFYPRTYSPFVTGGPVSWFRASGRARLFSYIIDHRAPAAFGPANIIAVVELDEGPRMMTNLVDVEPDPDRLELDMPLSVRFEKRGDWAVPVFGPVTAGRTGESGTAGRTGESGTAGRTGESGTAGRTGEPGTAGGDR
jgi:uncharacterized OB-fold protein